MNKNKEIKKERTRCEVFTRCVGYLRPISQFNAGKQAEVKDRVTFDIKKSLKNFKK